MATNKKVRNYAQGDAVKPVADTSRNPAGSGDTGIRQYTPFMADVGRQEISAAMLGQDAAGQKSKFNAFDFYGAGAAEAQRAGRNIAGQQQNLANALAERAAGRGGPSVAEIQLGQTLEGNKRAAASALASAGRSINPALATALLSQQRAGLTGEAAGQGALLRAQEQLAAQQALGQQLAGMRGAEGQLYGQAGQLGLGQEKLAVETQEAQTNRLLELAFANQKAEQERQRLQQVQENQAYEQARASRGQGINFIGNLFSEAAKALFYNGGQVPQNYAEGGKVSKAKMIASHAAMKKAKQNKLADGDIAKEVPDSDPLPPMDIRSNANIPEAEVKFGSSGEGGGGEKEGGLPIGAIVKGIMSLAGGAAGAAEGGVITISPEDMRLIRKGPRADDLAPMNISSNPGGGEVSEKAGKGLQTFGKGLAKKISEANAAAGSFAEGGDVMAAGAKGKSWKQMKWTDSPPWLSKDKVYEEFTPDVLRQLKESGDEGKFRHWGDLSNYNSMILDEIDEKKKGEKKPPIIFPLKKEVEEVPEMLKRNPTPKGEMLNAAQGGKVNAAMGRLQKMDNKKKRRCTGNAISR